MNIRDKDRQTASDFVAAHAEEQLEEFCRRFPESQDSEIAGDWVALACYLKYRLGGMDHQLAAMQACRRGPRMKGSDQGFNENARHRMGRMNGQILDRVVKRARKAGIATQGKFYVGPLADRRGPSDPRAWVSTVEEVRSVVRERNYESTGCVEHRAVEMPAAPRVALADEVRDEILGKKLQGDPGLREKIRRGGSRALAAAREEIVSKHGRAR